MNLANFMTFLRILAIPVFIAVYYADFPWHYLVSSLIFIFACITDWLDGYLARKLDQCTPFGAFIDPVADKILVTVALVMLAAKRARQIATQGKDPLVEEESDKPTVIALREIAEGMVTPELIARETEIEAEEELAASFETPLY